ncbi:MAG: trypsin-like peptidase domain-containing protein [Planctomycetes bacterium]|nr:trypsin-like peptidase domain-containing protein [Planctomycetota bacterium]
MKRILLVLVILSGYAIWDAGYEPQISQINVVDFSKKPSGNPYQESYEKMLYPTVRISTLSSTGSGVVIGDYILTAAHVVSDCTEVQVEVYTDVTSLSLSAFVVITDTDKDLALLRFRNSDFGFRIYPARLAPESYTPYIFTPVYTVGCSLGLPPRPSAGIISVIDNDYWEVSSPILPGNSGGPVYDGKTYEVIGIAVWVHTYNNQIVTTMAGIVPIQSIHEFLSHYKNTE